MAYVVRTYNVTIVNKGSSLTIVNETTNFIKTSVLKKDRLKTTFFKKRSFLKTIVSFSIFRRRYHNETIVFLKNENVNIPKHIYSKFPCT